jgi:hypothetical protein
MADLQQPSGRDLTRAAFQIPFFRKVPASQVSASWPQLLAIVAISLVPPLMFAAANVAPGRFTFMHLPGVLFHVPVMLIVAIAIAIISGRGGHVRAILAATLLAWTMIDALSLAGWGVAQPSLRQSQTANLIFYYGPIAWLSLAIARFGVSLERIAPSRKVWIVVAAIVLLGVPLGEVHRERSLWTSDWEKRGVADWAARMDRISANSEAALYGQPELLRNELAAVKPQRKGVVDVYLVAVAGYGSQDVFMREVDSVAALFRERFDADGHIVKLINNPKTALTNPIASVTSLKASLARVGELMDRDEDVLVLFLTSHGSADHRFSVELQPFRLRQISPEAIREALDESGIRNRVVIVSACYAGGFVPGLKDDNTLVITAAAPDKSSFGCSNESEWTYFGKAYFDEALRRTTSFTGAFEAAKPVIAEREKKQGFDPSMPQMSEGAAIKAKLEQLERQLASRAR